MRLVMVLVTLRMVTLRTTQAMRLVMVLVTLRMVTLRTTQAMRLVMVLAKLVMPIQSEMPWEVVLNISANAWRASSPMAVAQAARPLSLLQ
jgi:hypothetical protein